MSPELTSDSLLRVTQQTLEEAAFVFTEPQEQALPLSGRCLEVKLGFEAQSPGTLVLRAPWDFANMLAANLLGAEPEDQASGQMARAAVGELLNMIGGVLLESWFQNTGRYHLGIPEVTERPDAVFDKDRAAATLSALLVTEDQQPLEVLAFFSSSNANQGKTP